MLQSSTLSFTRWQLTGDGAHVPPWAMSSLASLQGLEGMKPIRQCCLTCESQPLEGTQKTLSQGLLPVRKCRYLHHNSQLAKLQFSRYENNVVVWGHHTMRAEFRRLPEGLTWSGAALSPAWPGSLLYPATRKIFFFSLLSQEDNLTSLSQSLSVDEALPCALKSRSSPALRI